MLYILQKKPQYLTLTLKTLKRLQLKHRFQYRNRTIETQEAAWEIAYKVVLQHLKTRQSARYRITYAHSIAQMTAKSFISRN
jgi:hypothetical protein